MSVIPNGKVAKIEFCEERVSLWNTNSTAMGSSAAAVTAWQAKVEAARAAYLAQKEAQNAAKSKTNDFTLAMNALVDATTDIIKQVKTQAAIVGDTVYSLADIPAPATPTPVGPLAQPGDFKVTLGQTGLLDLSWKCAQPRSASGVTYQVWRRIGSSGAFTCLGGTGAKTFTDSTIPQGSPSVTYRLQATRSTSLSPWAEFTVNFGVDTGGTMVASISEGAPTKAAA